MVAAMLSVAPASAQATRTWVSGVGDDANPCSRTAPCKTFAGAISKTAGGGEINVLDPGGFGGVTITKSITIRSTFEAGVLVSGTNAIIVQAGVNDNVILQGLDIEGLGTGINGIRFLTGKSLTVDHCWINKFTSQGIDFSNSQNGASLIVKDTVITKNAGGIVVTGASGIALGAVVINSVLDGQTGVGMQANGNATSINYANTTVTNTGVAVSTVNGGSATSWGPSSMLIGAGAGTPQAFK